MNSEEFDDDMEPEDETRYDTEQFFNEIDSIRPQKQQQMVRGKGARPVQGARPSQGARPVQGARQRPASPKSSIEYQAFPDDRSQSPLTLEDLFGEDVAGNAARKGGRRR